MASQSWNDLSNNEKLDRLTTVLTRAGTDADFRRRCLESPAGATRAVAEAADVEFPAGFEIEFLSPEQRLNKLILTMPDYTEPMAGTKQVLNAEDYQPCTYQLWRS